MESLAAYLAAHNMTPTEFARRIGARDSSVIRWAADERTPTVTWALEIERATEGAVPVAAWTEEAVELRQQAKKPRKAGRLVRGRARRTVKRPRNPRQ